MISREQALKHWLTTHCQLSRFQLQTLKEDASFRRYYRVHLPTQQTYIAMDAPPDRENCVPFVAVDQALRRLGLQVPDIVASDITNGFLLLSDFGDQLYLNELNASNANMLYGRALDALAVLQTCRHVENWTVPLFTADFMRHELELFKEWFLQKHWKITLSAQQEIALNTCFDFLAKSAANQHYVFMHRDYHSANLMVLPNNQVGILDFQDAFMGPVTYDLVSLLRDCYIAWPEALVTELVISYWQRLSLPNVSADEFIRWFDLMGIQRHLKALLTFSRKCHRDGNANYLQHIPRTLNYIVQISARYSDCRALHQFLVERETVCAQ